MAYGGDAVGKVETSGLTLFAGLGIAGEQARVAITERRKNLLRGIVTEIIQPSPLRQQPPCPYFGPCGGCQWQHIDYDGQVQFKHDILRDQLSRIGAISDPNAILMPPVPSPHPFSYRNTSHFAVDAAARSIGYFTRDSHSIVPVGECTISI